MLAFWNKQLEMDNVLALWIQSRGFREARGADVQRPTIKENSINNIWNTNCLNTSTLHERGRKTQLICAHTVDVIQIIQPVT